MLTLIPINEELRVYWVYGRCVCGHLKDLTVRSDGLPFADTKFHCTRPDCGESYSLTEMLKEKAKQTC